MKNEEDFYLKLAKDDIFKELKTEQKKISKDKTKFYEFKDISDELIKKQFDFDKIKNELKNILM